MNDVKFQKKNKIKKWRQMAPLIFQIKICQKIKNFMTILPQKSRVILLKISKNRKITQKYQNQGNLVKNTNKSLNCTK